MKHRSFASIKELVTYLIDDNTRNIPAVSEETGIPYNTLYQWYKGKRDVPKYVLAMITFAIENDMFKSN